MYGTEAGIVVEVSSLVMKRTPNSVSLYFTLSRSLLLLPSSNFYLSLCSCNWRSLLCLVHHVLLSLFLSHYPLRSPGEEKRASAPASRSPSFGSASCFNHSATKYAIVLPVSVWESISRTAQPSVCTVQRELIVEKSVWETAWLIAEGAPVSAVDR